MFERLLITAVIVFSFGGLWFAWQWYKVKLARSIPPTELIQAAPTVLYFTADYCAPCRLQQTPIMEALAAKLGQAIVIQRIDVSQHPNLASHYKVITLPTTIILDNTGQVTHINYGVASQAKLEAQLI